MLMGNPKALYLDHKILFGLLWTPAAAMTNRQLLKLKIGPLCTNGIDLQLRDEVKVTAASSLPTVCPRERGSREAPVLFSSLPIHTGKHFELSDPN